MQRVRPRIVVFLGVAVCSQASVSPVWHALVVTVVEMDNIILIVVLTNPIPILVYVPRGITRSYSPVYEYLLRVAPAELMLGSRSRSR